MVDKIYYILNEKVSTKDFELFASQQINNQEMFKKELVLKASIKDVCILLDSKANIEDINKALSEIHKEIELKANHDDLNNVVND